MKNLLLPALFFILFFCSCSKGFFAPALFQHDVSYLPKPSSFDSAKTATYISAGGGVNQTVDFSNTVFFGELNISEAHAFKNTNLAYGAYGFIGGIEYIDRSYQPGVLIDSHTKSYYGYGGRASFNFYKVIHNVNFRYLGVEAHYSKEAGDYAAYRRSVFGLPNYTAITYTDLVTLGATSEAFWHSKKNPQIRHAIRGFLGKTFGHFDQEEPDNTWRTAKADLSLYLAVSYFLNINHFWGSAEMTKSSYLAPGMRVKIGYKF